MIAPAFPPALGGMQELAGNLARELAATDDVLVLTRPGNASESRSSYRLECTLTGIIERDVQIVADHARTIDVWLGMQASMSLLARHARRPFLVYCYGNDFLNPWEPHHVAGWIARRFSNTPFLWRYAHAFPAAIRRARISPGFRMVRRAVAISRETAQRLCETMPIDKSRVSVIPPGVADEYFQTHREADPSLLRMLTVCRLPQSSRKNVDGVLHAMTLLRDVPILYTIVGEGPDRQRLEMLSNDLGLADRVRFAGALERSQLLTAYRAADLFVLAAKATTIDIEGFGIVYLEAAASGVPVIASRKGGAIDAVREGQNGILLDRSEPADIANGIRLFWNRRHEFTSDRVRAVAEDFRWGEIARQVRNVLLTEIRN